MSGFFRCAETKLLFQYQVNFVCSYVLYSYTTLSRIFLSELYNIRLNLRKLSPICPKQPITIHTKFFPSEIKRRRLDQKLYKPES